MRSRTTRFALGVMALASTTAVLLGRQSGVPAWHSVWAEDGEIFLADALNEPLVPTIFQPYNGYMLLFPRVAAEIVTLAPLTDAAWLIAVIASFAVGSVAVFVFHASSVALSHQASRAALAAGVVLLPSAGFETTANLANLHWYLIFGCFWALLVHRSSPGILAARTVLAFLAPLSNPIAAFLTPLLFLGRSGRPYRLEQLPKLAFLVGLATQLVVVVQAPNDSSDGITSPFSPLDLPQIFAVRVAGSFLIGDRFVGLAASNLGVAFELGAILLLGLILGWAVRGLDRARRKIALLALCAAFTSYIVPLATRGTSEIWPAADAPGLGGSRYFILPILFLLVVLLIGVDARLSAPPSQSRTILVSAAALWLVSLAFLNYSIANPRSPGPNWRTSLAEARQVCRTGPSAFVNVPIAPGGPWSVTIPCRR